MLHTVFSMNMCCTAITFLNDFVVVTQIGEAVEVIAKQ